MEALKKIKNTLQVTNSDGNFKKIIFSTYFLQG
jgi:hypothetical protein